MSLNIQTSNGLLEIGGKVTKEKVVEALGYSPADESHVKDGVAHITSKERETWNNKSDVVAYSDLLEAPNIRDDESGNLTVEDEDGNVIMKVDSDGITTTNVNTNTINLNGEDLGVRLDILESVSLPNIVDDESGELSISDEEGNKIVKIDANGLTTTTVTAHDVVVNGVYVGAKLDEHKDNIDSIEDALDTHIENSDIHIMSGERDLWNNKSDVHTYADLPDAPNIVEDNSGEVVYADESRHVIAKIGENGFETTQVIAHTVIAGGVDVSTTIASHTGNGDIHITAAERQSWNAKADKSYVDETVANLVDSAPETLDTLNELAVALGNDKNFATTVATQIGQKADKSDVDALKDELNESITSESDEWIVADEAGNIIAKVDANGFETTTVTAKAVVVGGVDVGTTLAGKSDAGHEHNQYLVASDISGKADKSYVDEELAKKADSEHTHDVYLEASDIAGLATQSFVTDKIAEAKLAASDVDLSGYYTKAEADAKIDEAIDGIVHPTVDLTPYATTQYVGEELAKKSDSGHTHSQYLVANDVAGKADKSYVDEELAKKANSASIVGRSTAGTVYTIDGKQITAKTGAEVFNCYDNTLFADTVNVATGYFAHAEGEGTQARGNWSHAEGLASVAKGNYSHSEGFEAVAKGDMSHAEGFGTIASGDSQHVQGEYNIEDTDGKYAHIVGNGEEDAPSNAHTLDWDGNAWFAGDVYVGGTSQNDEEAEKLARISDIANYMPEVPIEVSWNDILDKPSVSEDENTEFYISDESGNLILKVDSDGVTTTQVVADKIIVGGTDIESRIAALEAALLQLMSA